MRKIPILKWSLYFCRLLSKMVYVFLKSLQILYTNIVIIIRIYNKFGVRIMHTGHINIHSSSVLLFYPSSVLLFHLPPRSRPWTMLDGSKLQYALSIGNTGKLSLLVFVLSSKTLENCLFNWGLLSFPGPFVKLSTILNKKEIKLPIFNSSNLF